MHLVSIETKNLYGWIDLELDLNSKTLVNYFIGSNGVGKTSLLRSVYELSKKNWGHFRQLNFEKYKFVFQNNAKKHIFQLCSHNNDLYCYNKAGAFDESEWAKLSDYEPAEYKKLTPKQKAVYIAVRDKPFTKRAHCGRHWDTQSEKHITDARLLQLRADIVLSKQFAGQENLELPDISFLNQFSAEFIETDRLSISFKPSQNSKTPFQPIVTASKQIREQVNLHFTQALFQNQIHLNNNFINKLMKDELDLDTDRNVEDLVAEIERLEAELEPFNPNLNNTREKIDTTALTPANETVLKFYLTNQLNQLKEHETFIENVKIFRELVSSSMTNYKVTVDIIHGLTLQRIGQTEGIPLESLSSGEKQLVFLAFRLIFDIREKSLVLIDEPEISMHPEWQMKFSNLLQRIGESRNLRFILATHSPSILNNNWENAITVKPVKR